MRSLLLVLLLASLAGAANFIHGTLTLLNPDPHVGDTISFAYTTDKPISDDCTAFHTCLRIQVVCEQVDEDGISHVVYGVLEQARDNAFTLDWAAGPASCIAGLFESKLTPGIRSDVGIINILFDVGA